ncbi:DUF3696 domain-containing protein [Roseofilum reptotaenium CS-1145]|nr:DUF3696 domain-containing protein [Roseofilum reptotaenium]MDB9517189.1 DUF3696 domain-containing protein [Roseofilum reptotaenium CS-1145]
MIELITLKNFKAFESQSLDFKNLTLLSGLNSSGKSSVLHSLLVLRQSYQQDLLPDRGLALNGDLVCIGTAQDALFEGAKEDSIGFELKWKDGREGGWQFDYNRAAEVLELRSSPAPDSVYKSNLFGDNFHYLQAERIGSRSYLGKSEFQVHQHRQMGTQGEYTAHFFSRYRDENVVKPQLAHTSEQSLNLEAQVEAWMGEVSPGTRITIRDGTDLDIVSLKYSYGLSNLYRATNVGFGISYTLPIIVAILASKPGALILLENPEAHLHPKGQAKIGELLALAASCGIQVIVETHSDHILNGIRLTVHRGKLDPNDVQLHYFQRQEIDREFQTEVISPKMDRHGRIDNWPDGFFDEWDKSLEALLEPTGDIEMVFNELSLQTPAPDIATARQWMSQFIQTLRTAKKSGIKRLHAENNMNNIMLAPDYPVARWRNDPQVDREERRFLLLFNTKTPLWTDSVAKIKNNFDINLSDFLYQNQYASGLGFAWVTDSLSVSLLSDQIWDCSYLNLDISHIDENENIIETQVSIIHASRTVHIIEHEH